MAKKNGDERTVSQSTLPRAEGLPAQDVAAEMRTQQERVTAMELDVVDEGRLEKEGIDTPANVTRDYATPMQPKPPETPPPAAEIPREQRLGANFPLSPGDLPTREKAQQLKRKTPLAGNWYVQQICREDLDERPRLGKTIVVCPYDKVFCEQAGSERGFTLFTCPVEGCEHTRKIVKPMLRDILMRDHQDDFSARA